VRQKQNISIKYPGWTNHILVCIQQFVSHTDRVHIGSKRHTVLVPTLGLGLQSDIVGRNRYAKTRERQIYKIRNQDENSKCQKSLCYKIEVDERRRLRYAKKFPFFHNRNILISNYCLYEVMKIKPSKYAHTLV